MVQKNADEISAVMDSNLAAERTTVAAGNDAIKGLEEGIAESERLIRLMFTRQELLDSVRCLSRFNASLHHASI